MFNKTIPIIIYTLVFIFYFIIAHFDIIALKKGK